VEKPERWQAEVKTELLDLTQPKKKNKARRSTGVDLGDYRFGTTLQFVACIAFEA
jgi:hypothetical protein